NASRTYPLMLFETEGLLDKMKGEKLPSIRAAAIAYAPSENLFGGHFYDSATEIELLIKKAKFMHLESEREYSAKKRGYVAFSFYKEQEAIYMLGTASSEADESLSLAKQIEIKLLVEVEAAENAILKRMRLKEEEPLVYDYLEQRMQEYGKLKENKAGISEIGERINHLQKMLELLEEMLIYSEATDFLAEKISSLMGRVKETDALLSKAEKDGLAVFEEREQLKAIKATLSGDEIRRNGKLVAENEADLDGMRSSILAKASEKYSDAERMFFELDSLKDYLPSSDRLKLESYAKFIDGSGIDFESALGSMKELEAFVLRKSEELEIRMPQLVKANLEGNMLIREISQPAGFGEPVKFTAFISFENQMQFDAIGIRLKLPVPSNCRLLNSTPGLFIEKTGSDVFLAIESDVTEYFAILEFDMVANELVEKKEIAEQANFDSVRKSISFDLNTTRTSKLLIEVPLLSKDFVVDYPHPFEKSYSSENLILIADAPEGKNSLSIGFEIPEPFSLSIEKSSSEDALLYDFSYESAKLDIPSAKLDFSAYTECEIAKVLVQQSDFTFTDSSRGNFLSFSLSAKEWKKGQQKRLSLKLICNNKISSIISSSLRNITGSRSLAETIALEAAKQQLSEGNYAAVLSFLNQQSSPSSSSASNTRLNSICQIAQFMLQENYEREFGLKLNSECTRISSMIGGGNAKEAEQMLSSAEKDVEQFLSDKLETARKKCKAGCDSGMLDSLQSLSIRLLSKDYLGGVKEAMKLDNAFESKLYAEAMLVTSKLDAFSGYLELKTGGESAISDFNLFFSANEQDSKSLKYYDSYKEGSAAKTDLEKMLKELALVDNSLQINDSAKYSAALIKTKMEAGLSFLVILEASNSEIISLAEAEFTEATKRQQQFGDDSLNADFQKAQDLLDSENYFSAYMLAKSLNLMNLQPKAEEKFDPTPYALPSLALLIGGAYFLLFRNKNEQIIEAGEKCE
ncbi:MAG: hypothetical protein V1658_00175, partial [Candidatus Micrarchaeota archaeon]